MAGTIHVITGGMFSGKSEELMRQIHSAQHLGNRVDVFYPRIAERQSPRDIQNRIMAMDDQTGLRMFALQTDDFAFNIIERQGLSRVIVIDEAQFFSPHIVQTVKKWRRDGRYIWIAGLDMDYLEQPFGSMGDLMCLADGIMKLHATCHYCHEKPAFISHRVSESLSQVDIGETNYVALCLECYGREESRREYGSFRETAH